MLFKIDKGDINKHILTCIWNEAQDKTNLSWCDSYNLFHIVSKWIASSVYPFMKNIQDYWLLREQNDWGKPWRLKFYMLILVSGLWTHRNYGIKDITHTCSHCRSYQSMQAPVVINIKCNLIMFSHSNRDT